MVQSPLNFEFLAKAYQNLYDAWNIWSNDTAISLAIHYDKLDEVFMGNCIRSLDVLTLKDITRRSIWYYLFLFFMGMS